MAKLFLYRRGHKPDYFLLACFLCLTVFGLFALSSASSDLGKIQFNDTYHYLMRQLYFGLSFGLVGFFLGYKLYYKNLKKWAVPLLLATIALLIAVLATPLGFSSGGSMRWIMLGPVTIQPSEILKVTFIIYLAAWLSGEETYRKNNFMRGFLPFSLLSGFIALLLIVQPATSAVVIIMLAALTVYFMSGARISYIGLAVFGAVAALAILVAVTPYRFQRFASFLSPDADVQGSGFHLQQALISLGTGGLTGVGFGRSTNKYLYLPESIGDSIFVIIGEELGFIGAASLIIVFFALILKGLFLAKNARDEFGKLLMIGFVSVIGFQVFLNIGALSGMLPLTGVTLPFISYGGSSLATFMTMAGIMANISKYT